MEADTDKAQQAGLDDDSPDICEAAALAHDLGHPPFGHVAEKELLHLADEADPSSGFEGNAQSFRILTELSPRKHNVRGLDLTKATLNATLKYPWVRGGNSERPDKWGAYASESTDLDFARGGDTSFTQSAEASIMDLADDIAYSTHDVIDFFRAGLIPPFAELDMATEIQNLKENENVRISADLVDKHAQDIRDIQTLMTVPRFTGTWEEAARLNSATSVFITMFTKAVEFVSEDGVTHIRMGDAERAGIAFLKHLVWTYVILNPRLATQQMGQRRIIQDLFAIYTKALKEGRTEVLPREFDAWFGERGTTLEGPGAVRLVIDIIASFTDYQAWVVHRRLTGSSLGSLGEAVYA